MKTKILYFPIFLFMMLFAVPNKQLERGKVRIYFAEKDLRIAQSALQIVHRQHQRLGEEYDLLIKPIHIYIADSKEIYSQYSGSDSPVWSAGLAWHDKMLVKSPAFSRQSLADFQKTLMHETVHLSLEGIPLPVWFHEGLAQIEAGQFDLQKRILVSRAFWGGKLMPAFKIEYLTQMDHADAEVAYAQSAAMVDFLIDYFTVGLVSKCLYFTQQTQNFERGFTGAFLMSPAQFEKLFRENVKDRYRLYILLDHRNLWALAPLLLILGFILTKIRQRKVLKAWEAAAHDDDEDLR